MMTQIDRRDHTVVGTRHAPDNIIPRPSYAVSFDSSLSVKVLQIIGWHLMLSSVLASEAVGYMGEPYTVIPVVVPTIDSAN